jgi:hypothetical protein
LVAVTVYVYEVPYVNPVEMVMGEDVPVSVPVSVPFVYDTVYPVAFVELVNPMETVTLVTVGMA